MTRKQELIEYLNKHGAEQTVILPLVDEVVFLEAQLEELKKFPFVKIHPKDPFLQKATPVAKLYKEMLQQYTNVIKVLSRASDADGQDEDSPLRAWVRKHIEVS